MARDFDDSLKIRLPASLKARLHVVARRRLVGISDIIREQALAYLALNEPTGYVPRAPRKKVAKPEPANGDGDESTVKPA